MVPRRPHRCHGVGSGSRQDLGRLQPNRWKV